MSKDWREYRERGTVFWLHVITWIALNIGRPVASLLLYPITLYFFVSGSNTRRASNHFLGIIYGRKPRWYETFFHHKVFATTILDRLFLLKGDTNRYNIRTFNSQQVLQKLDEHRGCILLGSHLGSFEMLRVVGAGLRNTGLKIVMNEDHNRNITQFLNRFNPDIANTVVSGDTFDVLLKLKENLDNGSLVAIMGDRVQGNDKWVDCEFLGRPAKFPITAATLALLTGAPLFVIFGLYQGGNRYDIHFEKLYDGGRVDRAARQKEAERLTCLYAAQLEKYARIAPYNWFNFYDFWNHD